MTDWQALATASGAHAVDVPSSDWVAAVQEARGAGFDFFDWLSAVDQLDADDNPGLDVVLHLIATGPEAPRPLARTLITTRVPGEQALSSITGVFAGAAWHERETHEMFGLDFTDFCDEMGHQLRPLLLPDGFEGTPLAKSFVLTARASKPWPGAKEPGGGRGPGKSEGPAKPTRRRKVLPPGVPDPSWGPR